MVTSEREYTLLADPCVAVFYQDGCPYCKKLLQDNFGQKAIADKTQKHFDVIAVNMWGDREVTDLNGNATTEKKNRYKKK
ncbi:MAG TPA: hypothetical protein ENI64_00415 [Gammaproteobacteria bacterium]|nr:hypothetical protein [Gammaproteobacteria bacterium]